MKRRAWHWVGGTLAAIPVVFCVIVWDAHRRADTVIESRRGETEGLLAAYRARDFRRPPLRGEGVEGNAWDLYAEHLPVLKNLSQEEQAEIPEVDGTWEPDRIPDDEVIGVLLLKYAPQIQGLRDALQRRVVNPGTPFEQGSSQDTSLIPAALLTTRFLTGGIAHQHRMGRGREALDLAAIGLGLAHDQRMAVLGLMVRVAAEEMVFSAVRDVLADHRLSARDLEEFASTLDFLDRVRPTPADDWDAEELFMLCGLVSRDWGEELRSAEMFKPDPPGWRQLWSWNISRAQALSMVPRYVEEGRRLLALPTPARVIEVNRLLELWKKEPPPALLSMTPTLVGAFRSDVQGLAFRALLRVGVALAWHELETGAFPATLKDLVPRYMAGVPSCPYSGKPLGYKDGMVWSTGADGIDNGGTYDPSDGVLFNKEGSDAVLQVKRRK